MFSHRYRLQCSFYMYSFYMCSYYMYSYYMYSYYMYSYYMHSYYKCRVSDNSYVNHPGGLDSARRGCG